MSTNLYCQNYQLVLQLMLIEPLQYLQYKGSEHAGDNCVDARLWVIVKWVVTKTQGLVGNAEDGLEARWTPGAQNLKLQWTCWGVSQRKAYAAQ